MPNLIELLASRGQTLSTCESLTAGLVAASIADIPGASEVFAGGLVTYSAAAKTALAGVPTELIDAHGTVSPECATAMAEGARRALSTDWAVALTGVAGPDAVEGHPVGVVWLAIAGPEGTQVKRVLPEGKTRWALREGAPEPEEVCDGDRNTIRRNVADFAVTELVKLLSGN